MSEPEVFILARLIEQVDPSEQVPVTPHPCIDCARTCGISPSSVQAVKDNGWSVRCFECSSKMPNQPSVFAALPESLNEMRINRLAHEVKLRQN